MNIAYIRVSTTAQNDDRQYAAMEKLNIEKYFSEKVSGKDAERPELQAMLDFVREGDTVYIHDFSRLARSTKDLLDITNRLESKGVALKSIKENLDTSTPTGKLMLTMIGAINEFELATIHERQKEGIAIAREKGKYAGRKSAKVAKEEWDNFYTSYLNHNISKARLAQILGVSRPTLDKLIERYNAGIDIFK